MEVIMKPECNVGCARRNGADRFGPSLEANRENVIDARLALSPVESLIHA